MLRPVAITHPVVVNNGKPFEACGASIARFDADRELDIRGTGGRAGIFSICRLFFKTDEEMRIAETLIKWQLAQALNPPIEVTQAVLEAMEKVPEAKFWVGDDETKYRLERPCNTYVSLNDEWNNGRDFDDGGIPYHSKLQLGDYIQADCPLALQVLLGFTVEGVPVNE
jgi:hypothetical protein